MDVVVYVAPLGEVNVLHVLVTKAVVHAVTVSGTTETTGATVVKTEPEAEMVLVVLMARVTLLKAVTFNGASGAEAGAGAEVIGIGRTVV